MKSADPQVVEGRETPITPVLSNKRGLQVVVGLLCFMGAICPKCGHGTRAVSKKWRKCKKCGEKVERRELPANPEIGAPHEP